MLQDLYGAKRGAPTVPLWFAGLLPPALIASELRFLVTAQPAVELKDRSSANRLAVKHF
jgi:hypothetical protein